MNGFIRVANDNYSFINDATGESFVPLGANYFDPHTGWAPKIWTKFDAARVGRQLGQLGEAGYNCVRIFLDCGFLSPAEGEYSQAGFDTVQRMIDLCGEAGLRIIFSGPNRWERLGDHFRGDVFADPKAQQLQDDLWRKIVHRWGDEPTIMTWDLFNEPQVRWVGPDDRGYDRLEARRQLWRDRSREKLGREMTDLLGSRPGGVDREIYREFVHFMEDLAEGWTARQANVIREAGARQMVSVGLIQWSVPTFLTPNLGYAGFNPGKIAEHLDYMSVHFYPMLQKPDLGLEQEIDRQKAYLETVVRGAYVPGKPLVMEEFGWRGGRDRPGEPPRDQAHQSFWGDALMEITERCCVGWLNWGYADAADEKADISYATGLFTHDEQIKHWGKRMAEHGERLKAEPASYVAPDVVRELNRVDYLYDNDGHPGMELIDGLAAEGKSVEVKFTE